MTVEELDIIVTAKVEGATKEIKKLVPSIKQSMRQVQEAFSTIDVKSMQTKFQQTIKSIKKSMQELPESQKNNQLGLIQIPLMDNVLANIGNNKENEEAIVNNLSDAFNHLTGAMNEVVQSQGFQSWLQWSSDKLREISEKIASIDWQPFMNALMKIGTTIGGIALEILNGLVDFFKWIVENQTVAEILLGIAVAIGIISTVLGIISSVMMILQGVASLLVLPILGIIVAIAAVIAIIVLCITYWDEICQVVSSVVNAIIGFLQGLWNNVSFIFEAIWMVISTVLALIENIFGTVFRDIWEIVSPILNAIWEIISIIFQAVWNIVSSILGSIWNIFSQVFNAIWELTTKIFQGIWNIISPMMNVIGNGIKSVLLGIQLAWCTIWNTIANVVRNVWNGIWNCIKGIINTILGGIEGFINSIIRGINFLLGGISNVANAVGSFIGLSPINLRINTISLPRLAKGGVLTKATAIIAGEYSGAKTNPEIVTPQNIMEETFARVISRYQSKDNREVDGLKKLEIHFGSSKVAYEIADLLNQAKRKAGRAIVEM